jgi:hypothetical protein
MNFQPVQYHPIISLLKFDGDKPLCPFCQSILAGDIHYGEVLECDNCQFEPLMYSDTLNYYLSIKEKMWVSIEVDFKKDQITIDFLNDQCGEIIIHNTKLPFLDIPAMQTKIKKLLPFI